MKFNVRVSTADQAQARVFNVEAKANTWTPEQLQDSVQVFARMAAPKYCTVTVRKGCKKHRGKAMSMPELLQELHNLHFYYTEEVEKTVEKLIPLATFYKKPFTVEYADYIGATFFNNINREIITDVFTALNEVVPYCLYMAKTGKYYCWSKLTMRVVNVGRYSSAPKYRWQLCKVETVVVRCKIRREYV